MGLSGYLVNVVSAFVAIEYMDHRFKKRYSGTRRIVWFIFAWITYFMVVTGLNLAMEFEGILLLVYGAVIAVYGIAALDGSKFEMLKAGLVWVLILLLSAYIIYGILGIVTSKPLPDMVPLKGEMLIFGAAAGCGLKFSMGRIASAVFPQSGLKRKPEDWGIAGAFLLLLLLTLGLFALETVRMSQEARYGMIIALLLLEFGVVLLLEYMQSRLCRYRETQMEQEYRGREEEAREEELRNLYRIGREINHWRHDIVGELDVLHRLLKNGKVKEVETYIEKMNKELKTYPELPQETGNEGLDAALMKAIVKCKENGIYFCYRVLGRPGQIDAMELGRLMNNLLDNGIDACMNVEGERELELIVFCGSSAGLEIRIENTVKESVLKSNPELKSSKEEKALHGFGMESIRDIISHYQGQYICWEEDGMFGQAIFLPYQKKNS